MIYIDLNKTNPSTITRSVYFGCMTLLLFTFLVSSFYAFARPKINTIYGYSLDGFVRVKIKNQTTQALACWVAIDGFKLKFRLPALTESQWYTSKDKRYTYANFSTWCDYINLYHEYEKYNRG